MNRRNIRFSFYIRLILVNIITRRHDETCCSSLTGYMACCLDFVYIVTRHMACYYMFLPGHISCCNQTHGLLLSLLAIVT